MTRYLNGGYAQSLAEFGVPREIARIKGGGGIPKLSRTSMSCAIRV